VCSAAITVETASLATAMPSVGPYWSARAVWWETRCMISANSSAGNVEVSGRPPASEMTSGRSVIAMRSRMADDVITRVRLANSAAYLSRSRDATRERRGLMGTDSPRGPRPLSSSIVMPASRYRTMTLALDILAGIGLACACGLRPFLPAIAFGALAMANAAIDVSGTDLSFLESPVFVLVLVVLLVLSLLGHGYASREPYASAIAGLGIGLGALLFAGELADDGYTWWPGLIGGAAFAAFTQYALRDTLSGARERLEKEHAGGLPVYLEIVAALAAILAIFAPPVSIVYVAFLIRLLLARRRRDGEKYAGLRSLR